MLVETIKCLEDNFSYILIDENKNGCVVDPSEADPIIRFVEKNNINLKYILNTHHHYDHVGGNKKLKQKYNSKVVSSKVDELRIPEIDLKLSGGDFFKFGKTSFEIIFIPGHTIGHIAYWLENDHILFSGDTLFSSGCGRLFEGTPEQMWTSLLKLRNLPDDTNVYCAHEYTATNVDFALTIEPNNVTLKRRLNEVLHLRKNGKPTVPSNLGDEKRFNPFLRADNVDLLRAIGLVGKDAVSVFAEIRRRKDEF